MPEIRCQSCGWQGKWTDVIHRYEKIEDYCPKCGSKDLIDLDGVSEDDYREQNPREMPRE